MTKTNEEQNEIHNLLTNQLSGKMIDVIKNFKEENFHLENSYLCEVAFHASKIILQTNMCKFLFMLEKEQREKDYEELMKDFKEEMFKAIQEADSLIKSM